MKPSTDLENVVYTLSTRISSIVAWPGAILQQVNTEALSDYQTSTEQQNIVSPETKLLYRQRLEGGYDLPDKEYMKWLKENHSEKFAEVMVRMALRL